VPAAALVADAATTEPTTTPTEVATTLPTTEPTQPLPPPALPPRLHPMPAEIETAQYPDALDDQIGQSIQRGVDYLLGRMKDGRIQGYKHLDADTLAGLEALVDYALLHAGEATHDERLGPHSPAVEDMLKVLKAAPMDRNVATYARALRAAALGVYDRGEDRTVLKADAAWLLRAVREGGYSYVMPNGMHRALSRWDNSNSQYGVLGVWAAADTGITVPQSYWKQVQDHWLACQLPSGEWGYMENDAMGRLSMTLAGITTLVVIQDQMQDSKHAASLGLPPYMPALSHAMRWLESGDNAITMPMQSKTYTLYGLERTALASGMKYFGKHDWYRELAQRQLAKQLADGAWSTGDDSVDETIDTAFTLLFLSRGRHPVMMNKLRFDGSWDNRPRDLANLARTASRELERPINWQIVNNNTPAGWIDWMDSPILYIASHEVPPFNDADFKNLKAYVDHGGLIFTHADGESESFNRFVESLCQRLFPDYRLEELPPDHDVYRSLFRISPTAPKLQGVSNGSRLLLIHSPHDLARAWELRDDKARAEVFHEGLNIFIYAAGKTNLRNKLKTPFVPEPDVSPIATVPLARLRYVGNWDPEPAAWERFARQFTVATSIRPQPTTIDIRDLRPETAHLAALTGTGEVRFNDDQIGAMHDYVAGGGVLLIDACGGSTAFATAMRTDAIARAFPQSKLRRLPADHPILTGAGDGLDGLIRVTPQLRPRAAEVLGTTLVPLEILTEGRGCVIFSSVDLSTALVGCNTWGVMGAEPDTATALGRNVLLWALERNVASSTSQPSPDARR
jgi:hypothetical protein